MNFLKTLVDKRVIQESDVASIENEVATSGESLENILLKRGVDPGILLEVRGDRLKIPTRELGDTVIPFEVLSHIPEESALHYNFVPLGIKDSVLEVGMIDPDNIEALDALNFISAKENLPFKIFIISKSDFDKVIEMYKGLSGEVNRALSELETELSEVITEGKKAEAEERAQERGAEVIEEDAPVTKMVATILKHAVEADSSDIHVEPVGEFVRVRFRIDGVLNTRLTLPVKVHRAVVARIKILASIRLDEKRKPQDGRFSANVANRRIDFRVSTFPTHYGEKVVMRILDSAKSIFKIDELGLSERSLSLIGQSIRRPYGIILISGPTGSGKTSTLYAMLNELDREERNVVSLEDPVEYSIEGVSQSQVRPEIGYTFANGLRTTLRQDPDIIMVGEIRDKETAQLAIQAALTGHLVLTTIHTNNAIGVIPRLIDMGVDPYLIAPTLVLAMAQRLVRRLCPGSGKQVQVEGSRRVMIERQFADLPQKYRDVVPEMRQYYEISPTPECPSGTRGRIAVFEMFGMDRELEKSILENPVDVEIQRVARQKGMISMKEDAIIKALQGIIPFEEVNTLTTELEYDEVHASDEVAAARAVEGSALPGEPGEANGKTP